MQQLLLPESCMISSAVCLCPCVGICNLDPVHCTIGSILEFLQNRFSAGHVPIGGVSLGRLSLLSFHVWDEMNETFQSSCSFLGLIYSLWGFNRFEPLESATEIIVIVVLQSFYSLPFHLQEEEKQEFVLCGHWGFTSTALSSGVNQISYLFWWSKQVGWGCKTKDVAFGEKMWFFLPRRCVRVDCLRLSE